MAITLLLFQFNIKSLLQLGEGEKEGVALGRGFQDEPTQRRPSQRRKRLFSGKAEAAVATAAVEMVTAAVAATDIVIVPTAEIRGSTLF